MYINDQLKTVLALLSLVGIGFIGGFLAHRYWTIRRINDVAALRFAPGFEKHLFHELRADPELWEEIGPIVEDYARKIAQTNRESILKRKELIDSLHHDIRPYLNEAQIHRMEQFNRRFRDRPPPPPGELPRRRPRE